jgi:predicted PurR-regulated permease PerM
MKFSGLSRGLFSLAAFVLFIAGLKSAASIIIPFLLACFIAIITSPILVALKKRGVRPAIAVLIIILSVIAALWIMIQITSQSITLFASQSEMYQKQLTIITSNGLDWVEAKGINVDSETFNSMFSPRRAVGVVVRTLTQFLQGLLTNTFLILVTVVFLLLELSGLPNKLRMALGPDHPSIPALNQFSQSLNHYLALKSWISIVTGVLAYLICRFLGINYALLWGLMAFLLNYVPNIGSIIAAVPPVMLALVEKGTPSAIICVIGYLSINVILGNFIEPRLMGKGLGLSTLVVWLSLVFWGWVFGPVGMLLSVPLTMVVKIAMEANAETQWIAVLLGSDPGENALFEEIPKDPISEQEISDREVSS